MRDRARTADGRRSGRRWTEPEARSALAELAESGESLSSFARARGVSTNRIRYWRKRFGEVALVPSFVQVRLPPARTSTEDERIEVVLDDVVVRVQGDISVGRLAAIVHALAGREPGC
jgi:transposase-like protein